MELTEEFIDTLSREQLTELIINIVEQLKIENQVLKKKVKMLEELQEIKEENK